MIHETASFCFVSDPANKKYQTKVRKITLGKLQK